MIDVERLKHDRDYWDDVGAPEYATHYCPETALFREAWFKDVSDGYAECLLAREEDVWSRVPLTGETLIPRPTRKQWSGPEDVLPGAGDECRMRLGFSVYDKVRITYMGSGVFCYVAANGMEYTGSTTDAAFEPLRTEKERVVEAVLKSINSSAEVVGGVLGALYDAGALKMPEEDQ